MWRNKLWERESFKTRVENGTRLKTHFSGGRLFLWGPYSLPGKTAPESNIYVRALIIGIRCRPQESARCNVTSVIKRLLSMTSPHLLRWALNWRHHYHNRPIRHFHSATVTERLLYTLAVLLLCCHSIIQPRGCHNYYILCQLIWFE